jgi:hypothetical protein
MKVWTVHLRPGTAPVLVPEGFSVLAALFAPLWLFFHGARIAAALALFAEVVLIAATSGPLRIVLAVFVVWLFGLIGQDLRRWSLGLRGFVLSHVVAAANDDAAVARLFDQRPELLREALA